MFQGHTDLVYDVAWVGDGKIVSASADGTLALWGLDSREMLGTFAGHTDRVRCVCWLHDGRIASGSYDRTLRIWSMEKQTCLQTLYGHEDKVICVARLRDGRMISGAEDCTLRIWRAADVEVVLCGHTAAVRSVVCLPDTHHRAASCSDDLTLRLWDTRRGKCLHVLGLHTRPVLDLAAVDSRVVVSASADATLRLWSTDLKTCHAELKGWSKWARCVAVLAPDRVVGCGNDGMMQIWDTTTRLCCDARPTGHTGTVSKIIVLPDGRLVTASFDGTLKLWDAALTSMPAAAPRPPHFIVAEETDETEPEPFDDTLPVCKVMVLGDAGVGKSCLLARLQNRDLPMDCSGKPIPTVGVDIRDQRIFGIRVCMYDFAGQSSAATHPLFCCDEAVHLVVFRLDSPTVQMDISTHCHNIRRVAPSASMLLVGTHADMAVEPTIDLDALRQQLGVAHPVARISCLDAHDDLSKLLKPLEHLCSLQVASSTADPDMYRDLVSVIDGIKTVSKRIAVDTKTLLAAYQQRHGDCSAAALLECLHGLDRDGVVRFLHETVILDPQAAARYLHTSNGCLDHSTDGDCPALLHLLHILHIAIPLPGYSMIPALLPSFECSRPWSPRLEPKFTIISFRCSTPLPPQAFQTVMLQAVNCFTDHTFEFWRNRVTMTSVCGASLGFAQLDELAATVVVGAAGDHACSLLAHLCDSVRSAVPVLHETPDTRLRLAPTS